MREADIQAEAVKRIRRELHVLAMKMECKSFNGWPDVLVILGSGRHIYMEFKVPGRALDVHQQHVHWLLDTFGCEVHTVNTVEGALAIVKRAKEEEQ